MVYATNLLVVFCSVQQPTTWMVLDTALLLSNYQQLPIHTHTHTHTHTSVQKPYLDPQSHSISAAAHCDVAVSSFALRSADISTSRWYYCCFASFPGFPCTHETSFKTDTQFLRWSVITAGPNKIRSSIHFNWNTDGKPVTH